MKPAPITTTRRPPPASRGAHGERVVERPQHVDVSVRAVVADVLRRGPGGDDHPVEVEASDRRPSTQRALGEVESLGRHPELAT